jgi:hypothetical protein
MRRAFCLAFASKPQPTVAEMLQLQERGIAGLEGRAAEGGSGGSHRQDGTEPHPHRPANGMQVGVRRPGGNSPQCPR